MKPDTMMIDDVKYVREDKAKEKAPELDGLDRCVIRTYSSGIFVGYVAEQKAELNGVNITLKQSKRIHYWDGACSLTQLAIDGTKAPANCRITEAIESQFIANVIEMLPMTKEASVIIDGVKPWKK